MEGATFMRPPFCSGPMMRVSRASFLSASLLSDLALLAAVATRMNSCHSFDSVAASLPVASFSRPIAPPFARDSSAFTIVLSPYFAARKSHRA